MITGNVNSDLEALVQLTATRLPASHRCDGYLVVRRPGPRAPLGRADCPSAVRPQLLSPPSRLAHRDIGGASMNHESRGAFSSEPGPAIINSTQPPHGEFLCLCWITFGPL